MIGTCLKCGRIVEVKAGGQVAEHYGPNGPCGGSGMRPRGTLPMVTQGEG